MKKISIALCTCNGETFLADQLQSYLDQQRAPDEVIVCDDASSDATVTLLSAFAQSAPFPVRITRNPARLGITANFAQAIAQCNGDYIALSDQDDVWLPCKLARLEKTFENRPDALAAFSDAQLVSRELGSLRRTVWQSIGFGDVDRRAVRSGNAVAVLVRQPVVTGATLMFRSGLRTAALPIPAGWMHDEWLAMLAAAAGGLVALDDALILYRQHTSNAIGGTRKSLVDKLRAARTLPRRPYLRGEFERLQKVLERLGPSSVTEPAHKSLLAKLAHLERRLSWPSSRLRRWMPVVGEWLEGGYRRSSRNWHSIVFDLLATNEHDQAPPPVVRPPRRT